MLNITREVDGSILIYTPAGVIKIMVTAIELGAGQKPRPRVQFGIDAPQEYLIVRAELAPSATRASGKPARSKGVA